MGNLGFQEILLIAIIVLIILGVFLIPFIFFLITLQKTLKAIEPVNRRMEPGNVWLLFIPLFNLYWMFQVVAVIADSAKAQLEQYGMYTDTRPTYNLGLAFAICYACNIIPFVSFLTGFASLVLLIIYWVQVAELKNQILNLRQTFLNREEGSIFG